MKNQDDDIRQIVGVEILEGEFQKIISSITRRSFRLLLK